MELLATGLFTGKLPKMPGTWGSIFAAICCYFFWPENVYVQLLVIGITFLISVVSADYVSKKLGDKDPDEVVIDEILGIEITFLGLHAAHNVKVAFLGLILFRVIDIMKPPPIKWFEKFPGGLGITVDDAVAGVISNVLLRLLGGFL